METLTETLAETLGNSGLEVVRLPFLFCWDCGVGDIVDKGVAGDMDARRARAIRSITLSVMETIMNTVLGRVLLVRLGIDGVDSDDGDTK